MKFNIKFNLYNLKLLTLVTVFILGLYYYINHEKLFESMENQENRENRENR